MRRLVVIAFVLALLGANAALAADPKKKINPADQALARAMLLKLSDVGLGFRLLPARGASDLGSFTCAALDESDLTVTGEAKSPNFTSGLHTIASTAGIYASAREASTSWRRGASAAGFTCLSNAFRRIARSQGADFVSFRKVPFPAIAPQTIAYRWQVLVSGVRAYTDVVLLMRGRAQAAAFFIAALAPLERSEELRLTRLISKRMAKAMRGA